MKELLIAGAYAGIAGAGVSVLGALYFACPIGWCALGGTLVGAIVGSLSQVLIVTIYQRKGRTLIKLQNA